MRRSSAVIVILLALALGLGQALPSLASPYDDISARREKAAAAREAAKEAEDEASRLSGEAQALDAQAELLQEQIDELRPRIAQAAARASRLRAEVALFRSRIAQKEAHIARTEAELAHQRGLLSERLTGTYKQGELFYLDLLLGSDDLTDLVARTALVQRVIIANQRLAVDLEHTTFELGQARDALARDLEAVSLKRADAEAEQRILSRMETERAGAMRAKRHAEDEKRRLVAENKENAERLLALAEAEERAAAEIEAELRRAASRGSGRYAGTMAWPTPGYTRITSGYGWRIHPILGSRRFHNGIDIGAPTGADVVAAGTGAVLFAGTRSGYGKTVIVDHGDGVATLYAHLSRVSVSQGQVVSMGSVVGAIGSTGLSTGPHLHFEVRVNGASSNPLGFL